MKRPLYTGRVEGIKRMSSNECRPGDSVFRNLCLCGSMVTNRLLGRIACMYQIYLHKAIDVKCSGGGNMMLCMPFKRV